MPQHRIYSTSFASVYPLYVAKAEKKGRTKAEVDAIVRWLTGYTQTGLNAQIKKKASFEGFFAAAPKLNPSRTMMMMPSKRSGVFWSTRRRPQSRTKRRSCPGHRRAKVLARETLPW